MAALCRKAAKKIVSDPETPVHVTDESLKDYLGPMKFRYNMAEEKDQIGAVTGLAWTEVGGDTLVIEVTVMPGQVN